MERQRAKIKMRWRMWRRLQRLSQIQLAKLGGVSRSTAQRWESSGSMQLPDVAQLATICDRLQIEPEKVLWWLLGGSADG